jgi:alpha-ketoglutarate-dependent taurine dioxygenase
MGLTIDPRSLAVAGTHLDATFAPEGRRVRFQAYWLRLLAAGPGRYAGVAGRWTDGANFHPDDDALGGDRIAGAEVDDDGAGLRVAWAGGGADRFSAGDLWRHAFEADPAEAVEPEPWDAGTAFPSFEHARVMDDDDALLELLRFFLRRGLAYLHGVPRREKEIERVAARLSTVQRSHLGDTFTLLWREDSRHLGETPDRIPLHIDMVYKQVPPDLQMLHVLEEAEEGGENVFVDAFHLLSRMDPADVRLLREVPVWFVAESEAVHFRGLHPIVAFDARGRFRGMHYNEYKMVFPVDAPAGLYQAFLRLRRLAADPANAQVARLPRDSIALFHNLRTLHARLGFRGTRRHLEGCYLSEDDLKSRYRTLAGRTGALAAP